MGTARATRYTGQRSHCLDWARAMATSSSPVQKSVLQKKNRDATTSKGRAWNTPARPVTIRLVTKRVKTIRASPVHSRLLLFTLRRIICGSTASVAKANASAPAHSANSEDATEGRKNLSGPQRNVANENGLPSRRHNQMTGT